MKSRERGYVSTRVDDPHLLHVGVLTLAPLEGVNGSLTSQSVGLFFGWVVEQLEVFDQVGLHVLGRAPRVVLRAPVHPAHDEAVAFLLDDLLDVPRAVGVAALDGAELLESMLL